MDNHTATELAYKNGYAKGVKEFAERLRIDLLKTNMDYYYVEKQIMATAKEMVGADNA